MNANARNAWSARTVLMVMMVLVLLPLIYQLGISFKQPKEIFSNPILPITWPPSLENYQLVLKQLDIPRYLLNSMVYAGGVTLGQLVLAIPAAFALSYFNFRLQKLIMGFVLLSLMVPFVVTYIPNYLQLAQWRLINTLPGMILPMLGISLGFSIFLLRQHFMSFPREVLQAAQIDGADSWQILRHVLAPAHISPIFAVAIYVLINTWNQLVWPSLVGTKPDNFTLTVAVQTFFTSPEGGDVWGSLMAASVLTSLPTIAIFLLMRRTVLRTFTEGAVKG